jgi:hypothetical protein
MPKIFAALLAGTVIALTHGFVPTTLVTSEAWAQANCAPRYTHRASNAARTRWAVEGDKLADVFRTASTAVNKAY